MLKKLVVSSVTAYFLAGICPAAKAETVLCKITGLGCPQSIPGNRPRPRGAYFAYQNATHYLIYKRSGPLVPYAYCSFVFPAQYQMYRTAYPSESTNAPQDIEELQFLGACPEPPGYFAWRNATHYSKGDGSYCTFPNPDTYSAHSKRRPGENNFGALPNDPSKFMSFTGACTP
jgi:hypothetical protein